MSPAKKKLARALIATAIGLVLAVVLAEVALRVLLFRSGGGSALVRELRKPGNFADENADDDFWKLQCLFAARGSLKPVEGFDPALGWAGSYVKPHTYEHVRAEPPDERRLVLLYGDSFSQCATSEELCFQGLMERSDLGRRYRMLNYGVGGYGLDQIYLMLQRSIDRYVAEKPIVIVGMLVENDLDRSILTIRGWPKTRLDVKDGELVSRGPVIERFDEYLERHPLEIRSYLYRLFAYRRGLLPKSWSERLRGDTRRIEEKSELNRALVVAIHRELESRGIEHFFLIFHCDGALVPLEWAAWQEPLVRSTCESIGARVISVRPYMLAAAGGVPEEGSRFFIHSGPGVGHLTPLGNAIALEAMRDGIEGRPEGASAAAVAAKIESGELQRLIHVEEVQTLIGREARIVAETYGQFVRESDARIPPFDRWDDRRRICIRPGEEEPTRLTFDRQDGERKFAARLRATVYPKAAGTPAGTVIVQVARDGIVAHREEIAVEDAWHPIAIDLDGVQKLTFSVARTPSTPANLWLCVSDPAFE